MTDVLLRIEALSKRFGGVLASDAISLEVPAGELHAIIGPNGAGKTTLIGQLAGEIAPDGGRIEFAKADITRLPAWRRSRLGLARSFQITSLFPDFSALDNVALAVQAHAGHSFRFWRDARSEPGLREPARAALARLAIAERADMLVSRLSHGEHRFHVVLDQQDGNLALELAQRGNHARALVRPHPGHRLIEQQHARPGGERDGELELALLAVA